MANIPLAAQSVAGVIKAQENMGFGVSNGALFARYNSLSQYLVSGNTCALSKGTLELAKSNIVRRALTDNTQDAYTDAEKASARERIGAEPQKGGWVFKGTLNTENKDTGVNVDLSGYTELCIKGWCEGTASVALSTNITWIIPTIAANGNHRVWYAEFKTTDFGMTNVIAKYIDGNYKVMSSNAGGYAWIDGKTIADINRINFNTPQYITDCNIEIYAR